MKIRLGSEQTGDFPGEFVFSVSAAALGLQEEEYAFLTPITVTGRCSSGENVVTIKGEISYRLRAVCCRCLEPFIIDQRLPWMEEFRQADRVMSVDAVEYDDASGMWWFHGRSIDLTEPVRENIITSLPAKAVCREDCRGLCPHCGANLNVSPCRCRKDSVDPRLAILQRWLVDNDRHGTL